MIDFYEIDPSYVTYLKSFDTKVPNLSSTGNSKFTCGVVLTKNGHKYFVPVSSFNIQQRTNFLIRDNGRAVASLRFCFMFPVPEGIYSRKIIANESNLQHRRFLQKELAYCQQNEQKILSIADKVYDQVVNHQTTVYTDNSCDFLKLETAASSYSI